MNMLQYTRTIRVAYYHVAMSYVLVRVFIIFPWAALTGYPACRLFVGYQQRSYHA